jgi:hypothetical protein
MALKPWKGDTPNVGAVVAVGLLQYFDFIC